jgi:hypothetical protein
MRSRLRKLAVNIAVMAVLLLSALPMALKPSITSASSPSSLAWPVDVSTAPWTVTSGYYNYDHGCWDQQTNPSGLACMRAYQLFGLDLVRKDNANLTASSVVLSPADGYISNHWSSPEAGECVIIAVDGYPANTVSGDNYSTRRISLCHVNRYTGIDTGAYVTARKPIGTIASWPGNHHLHFSLYDLAVGNGDSWEYRTPVPFTGTMHLNGCQDFTPDGTLNWAAKTYNGTHQKFGPNNSGDITCPSRPGGWWIGPTPSDKAIVGVPSTITLSAHVADNNNGGLSKVNITLKNPSDGLGWRILSSQTYASGTTDANFSALYSIPSGTSYVLVSFDVYGRNGSSQLAPNGIRKFCVSTPCEHDPAVNLAGYPWLGGGDSAAGATNCNSPSASQVALFTGANYSGNCALKDVGDYRNPDATGLPNDSITSVKVGSNIKVQLCRDNDLSNTCEWLESDDSDLSNNSVGAAQVSSVKVETKPATTGCVPGLEEVSLFQDANYGGLCVTKRAGDFNNSSAIGLSNDSISSVKVGDRMKILLCRDDNLSNTCEWIDYNDADLSNNTVGTNQASSAKADFRGGIELCNWTDYGAPCMTFGEGQWNLSSFSFSDVAESVRFLSNYQGRYHIELHTEANQGGNVYHADNNVQNVGSTFQNHIRSINIYKHQPPSVPSNPSPADGNVLSSTTTNKTLTFNGADESKIHVWGNGYDYVRDWNASTSVSLTGLTPGMYYWQAQSRNIMGEGSWSPVWKFAVNRPPAVSPIPDYNLPAWTGYNYVLTTVDPDDTSPTLSVSNLPSFATFSDNGNGTGKLVVLPGDSDVGTYSVTLSASDGEFTASDIFTMTVFQQRSTTVYNEALASGWQNWSWSSTVDFNDTAHAYTPNKDIKWTPTGAYSGLYLHNDSFVDTSGYYGITFALQASQTNSHLAVRTYDAAGNELGSQVSLDNYGGDPPTTYHRMYTIPFSALGATNTTISGFYIHDITGGTLQPIYVDRIKLVGNSGDPWENLPGNASLAYNDNLASGWQNWSWDSTINWTGGSYYTGANSISWTPTAGWAGMDIHNPSGVSVTSYTTIHFAMKATAANELFVVFLEDANGNPTGRSILLTDNGGNPPTGWWQRYDIPIADFGITGTTITGIVIQSNSGSSQSTVYVDEVGLY